MATETVVFRSLSTTTAIYEPAPDTAPSTDQAPSTILICGWMGGKPSSLRRYTTKYHTLYPAARIVLVSSDIKDTPGFRALLSATESKQRASAPAQALLPVEEGTLLIHAFSNGGGINLAAVSKAYRQLTGAALPARLVIFDSLPGGDRFTSEFSRWVDALAVGLPSNILIRWPARALLAIMVLIQLGLPALFGRDNAATEARRDLNDEKLICRQSKRLYLFSEADALIGAKEVREHAAEAASKGCHVETVNFQVSGHVRHAITQPDRYWNAVTDMWRSSA